LEKWGDKIHWKINMTPKIDLLFSRNWTDYELLDSGNGQKLERFGPYTFVRPEVQALWRQASPADTWQSAHGIFSPSGEESGGHWSFRKPVDNNWELRFPLGRNNGNTKENELKFSVMTTAGRHLGVFPECAAHWDWMAEKIGRQAGQANVLNLFGYTGLATLAAAAAGAKITHVDASRKSVTWARENQVLSGLEGKSIRWIVDDALKFVEREQRRGVKYDGILLDPPKFGRGPKGEVWEVYKSLPVILQACRGVLRDSPLFIILTVYAVKFSAIHAYSVLAQMMEGFGGRLECGELVTEEKSAGRLLSQAVYARWGTDNQ
jgi:23S rRNA (cytosine1962-C5)-methyltransferase